MPLILFRKILRDLARSKVRSALVVLSIAVGVAALGMTVTARVFLEQQLTLDRDQTRFAHLVLDLSASIDEATLRALTHLPAVAEADGLTTLPLRWKTARDGEWQGGTLQVVDDYATQHFNFVGLVTGQWPQNDQVVTEVGFLPKYNLPAPPSQMYFEFNGTPKTLKLVGAIHDPMVVPSFAPAAVFYASGSILPTLGRPTGFNSVRLRLHNYSREQAEAVVAAIDEQLGKLQIQITRTMFLPPTKHPGQDSLTAFLVILGVMGLSTLGISTFLVINTINALLAQQINQIGMMKAIGATTATIMTVFLSGIGVYGVLSFLIAGPLGAFLGWGLGNTLLYFFNVSPAPFQLIPEALILQAAIALLAPLLAGVWPIWRGAQISVREALFAYGTGSGHYGGGGLDKLLGRVRGLPSAAALALRNTFRRAGRVALTQLTLISAGAVFIMVLSTQSSFDLTIAQAVDAWGFDVQLTFARPYRISKLEALVHEHPDVRVVELWLKHQAHIARPGEKDINRRFPIFLTGLPTNSEIFTPRLTAGRVLTATDGHALVLNQKLARDLNVTVGDVVETNYGGSKARWTIVGLMADVSDGQQNGYVPREQLGADVGALGLATFAAVRLHTPTQAAQEAFAQEMRTVTEGQGLALADVLTVLKFKADASLLFLPIAGLLMIMAVLIAIVGSFSLSGTLSINVLERRREIGVMRAVGASSFDISTIFVGEGLLLGVLSWVGALPLGLLGAPALLQAISVSFAFPMDFKFSPVGPWLWLGIVLVLSTIASWFPAHQATQVSVRESLAYE